MILSVDKDLANCVSRLSIKSLSLHGFGRDDPGVGRLVVLGNARNISQSGELLCPSLGSNTRRLQLKTVDAESCTTLTL